MHLNWQESIPDGYSGYGNVACLPVGEPDYLSCHTSIRPKEAQYRYFGPNLNNHIYSLCVLGTLVQYFLIISASSTSTPTLRALVPLASSVWSLCHLCSSSSQPRSFSSASATGPWAYVATVEGSLSFRHPCVHSQLTGKDGNGPDTRYPTDI